MRPSSHRRVVPHSRPRVVGSLLATALVVAAAVVAGVATVRAHGGSLASPGGAGSAAPAASGSATGSAAGGASRATNPPLWALTPSPAAAVLSPLAQLPATGAAPSPAGLAKQVAPLLADPALRGDAIAMVVADPRSGTILLNQRGATGVSPASTAKLAVAVAALHTLGSAHQFSTRVVRYGANQLVLVGGGDPTLAGPHAVGVHDPGFPAPARLSDLAAQTASALKARGIASVHLDYDASLFTGAATAPGWKPTYITEGDVAPVSALEVDEGSPDLAKPARSPDPARLAASEFAALLSADGVQVAATLASTKAEAGAEALASVSSPPLSALVQRMLGRSDNDIAEALARQVAIATGRPATFAGGAAAVQTVVASLGVPAAGFAMLDGSGLSRTDRVRTTALVQLIDLVLGGVHPELGSILQALPVAGFSGTLADRYTSPPASAAAGRVWAKTGTLDGVVALAGYLDDASGRILSFAVIANAVADNATTVTESAIDRLTAGVASCGCF
jgi:serine-type D-Ala-D-Ala carboxypeptidase/endopeptidase (penicillin-binding protein 4)